MTLAEKKELCSFIDEKIELMQSYEEATKPIIEEDFFELGQYLDKRVEIMSSLREIMSREEKIISSQPEKEVLRAIFRLEALDKTYQGDIGELSEKLKSEEILFNRISKLEKQVEDRFAEEREDLEKEFAQLTKTKQVIDYMEQTAKPVIFQGSSFDKSL